MTQKTYEYYWNEIEKDWVEAELQTKGKEGWELVAVTQISDHYTLFFKRQTHPEGTWAES